MRAKNTNIGLLATAILLLGLAPFAWAEQATDLRQNELAIEKVQNGLIAVEATMRDVQQRLNQNTDEISLLKERSRAYTPYTDYRLKKLLQDANELAKQLTELEAKRRSLSNEEDHLQEQLILQLDKRIESLATQISGTKRRSDQRRTYSAEIRELVKQRDQLASNLQEAQATAKAPYAAVNESDSLEDLREKAAFLRDARQRLKSTAKEIRRKVNRAQRQKLILSEVRHFLDEEAFFAETSFAKRAPGSSNSSEQTKSLSDENTDNAKTGGESSENEENLENNGLNENGEVAGGLEDDGSLAETPDDGTLESPVDEGAGINTEDSAQVEENNFNSESIEGIRRVNLERLSAEDDLSRTSLKRLGDLEQYESMLHEQIASVEKNLRLLESVIEIRRTEK